MPKIHQVDRPDVVVVPASVLNDTKVTLNDLGLYVHLVHLLEQPAAPTDLEQVVGTLTQKLKDQYATDEQVIRASIRYLVEAGHLQLDHE